MSFFLGRFFSWEVFSWETPFAKGVSQTLYQKLLWQGHCLPSIGIAINAVPFFIWRIKASCEHSAPAERIADAVTFSDSFPHWLPQVLGTPAPKTPNDTFRQHDLCEQSTSRRSDRRAIALRASTAQSLRDCFAQDDTRGEMSVKIYHEPVGATCGRPLVGSAPFEGGRSQIAPTKSWDFR